MEKLIQIEVEDRRAFLISLKDRLSAFSPKDAKKLARLIDAEWAKL